MTSRNWFITGVSSGFGRELATQLLDRGDTVVGTVRRPDSAADLVQKYPDTFRCELLDVTDAAAVRDVVDRSFTSLGRIDVVVSNAGYGLFGAAEELSDEQVSHIIATNLTGSIQLIRASLPHLRAQGGGRIIQISTYRLPAVFFTNVRVKENSIDSGVVWHRRTGSNGEPLACANVPT
ncbi:MAG TPA: SDR family NAD(P)-dependent oxidoreductase [Streptosporangiaceae bacterium]|nr:SDR family NAD(P)-dependent oxidoreductase [Streptosporangiaceae bacterium]